MAVSQMKSPKIVDIYGLPGHCFVRVDSGKQCNPARIAQCLLVGSAPKPLKARAALCGCVVFLRHSTFWLRLKSKKEKPLCQLSCCEQHLTQGALLSFWVLFPAEIFLFWQVVPFQNIKIILDVIQCCELRFQFFECGIISFFLRFQRLIFGR